MSAQPPQDGPSQFPPPGSLRCPRCSTTIGPEQDWCLECGAPARTRLAPTPNWQLPTVAIAAVIAIAGALLAFAFVRLTDDDTVTPAGTTPGTVAQPVVPPAVAPPAVVTTPTATTTVPVDPAQPATTVPGQTTPPATTTTQTTTGPAKTKTTTTTPPVKTTTTPPVKTTTSGARTVPLP